MLFKDIPIQRKLITVNLLTSGAVLLLTCAAFFAYEYHTFRQSTIQELSTLGEIIATNSTAALAFDDSASANEILAALRAEPHIVAAVLYDTAGILFAQYPADLSLDIPGVTGEAESYQFGQSYLIGFQPVIEGTMRLGTLYLKSDLKAMEERFRLYTLIALLVIAVASLLAFLLSNILQKTISRPILNLAATARAISDRQDYSVRAAKQANDELGELNDAFNHMLGQIQEKNQALKEFNKNLEQKVVERTIELETAIKEQKEAEKEIYDKNQELAQALEELQSAEEHLIELNNDLEKRVQGRTRELLASEKALKVKNKELKKTNIDLDNFIYTASHDLKSPIVNIEGLLNLIRKQFKNKISSEDVKLLDMVDTSIQKLKDTIIDLTEITKVQKDLGGETQKISFREVLEDVKEGIRANIEESNAVITEEFKVSHLVYLRKDLRSIIYNLLSNAIKYRAQDRPLEINIKTYEENGFVVLSVQDNGMGISEHQLPKLFTMFKRLHMHVEGTGIGLYIIKRIIENKGGRIEVNSKLNEGTTFHVYIKSSFEQEGLPIP